MTINYHLIIFSAIFIFLVKVEAAVPILELNTSPVTLNKHIEVFEDKKGGLLLGDVIAAGDQFRLFSAQNNYWEKGFTRSAYWFRIRLHNSSSITDWYYWQWGSLSRQVELYLVEENKSGKFAGDFVKLPQLPHAQIIKYHLLLPHDSSSLVYLRVQDIHTPLDIHMSLMTSTDMVKWSMYQYPLMVCVVGGLLVLALYNFFYFLYLRDQGFLALSIFILAFTLEMAGHVGLLQSVAWLRDYFHSTGALFGMVCIACGIILFRQWFDTHRNQPGLDKVWRYAFWCSIALTIICPLTPFSVAVVGVWGFCMFPLAFLSTFLFYRQGLRLPPGILLAAIIFVVSLMPALLRALKLIDETGFLAEGGIIGLLLALMLLSISQAAQMRTKSMQAERITAANQARDEFLTTMSHELRTPMSSVVSAGQLLKLSALSEHQSEYVNRLNTSSKHMLSLINDILDLARLDQQNIRIENTPFQLKTMLQQTEQLLTEQVRNKPLKLVMDNHFHPLKKQLVGDPLRLQQVLLNLLNNAVKFTAQGEVSLTITPQKIDDHVSLLFEVRDTGIGIAKEHQDKLFQTFSQADNSTARVYGGSGLGLAISARLVSLMGGELQVESESGQGSRFFFVLKLPLSDEIPEQNRTFVASDATISPFTDLRVLLIDDHEMNRFFNSRLLMALAVKVTTAESGKQAIQLLRQHTFDLVFIDVSMPEMDGYETTREIRANPQWQHIPIVALTAHAISGERERCLAVGMDDYLPKPFTRKELQNMLHQHGSLKSEVAFQ